MPPPPGALEEGELEDGELPEESEQVVTNRSLGCMARDCGQVELQF